jgi:hypothetical protein
MSGANAGKQNFAFYGLNYVLSEMMNKSQSRLRGAGLVFAGLTVVAVAAVFFLPPIAQDLAYHNFADRRAVAGIPNFLNVISNLPFAFVGAAGLFFLLGGKATREGSFITRREVWPYAIFFLGVALTSWGSSYYHLSPDNERLVWDRLPMTLGFMTIFAATISERVNLRVGHYALVPLLAAGLASVLYWRITEAAGAGDLRFYAIVQFYPLIAIPLLLALFPPRYTRGASLVGALTVYGAAKLLEMADSAIFSMGQIVSGHSLKHLAAAGAAYWILHGLKKRRPVGETIAQAIKQARGSGAG